MSSQLWEDHHVPPELKENLTELYPGLTLEEALQHQESLYQSLKVSCVDQTARSSDNEPSSSHGHSWGDSSNSGSCDYDLALDEAVARSLQELDLEDEDDHVAVSESLHTGSRNNEHAADDTSVSYSGNNEHAADGTSVSDAHQDGIDPDRMTYEDLQSLGEAIGSESRGLSKREISNLPRYTYRSSIFSKKINIGECVICYTGYKNRDSVISLPCAHQYHKNCIETWLEMSKICPICQREVNLSSD